MSKISVLQILLLIAVLFVTCSDQQRNRCLGVPDGTFINDFSDCDAYFVCARNSMVRGRCAAGFYFNEEEQKCDHPWNVTCLLCRDDGNGDDGNGDEGSGENDEAANGGVFDTGLPVNFPIERECRKYTACVDDVGFLLECSEDLMFNRDPNVRACDLPENVDCTESVCPNNVNPSVPTFVPDLTDCSKYHICFNWDAVGEVRSCAGDLLFNPVTRECDFPENVDCDHILPVPPTSCKPTGIHHIPAEECNQFYVCVNGEQREPAQTCLGGTIFDVITMTCRNESDDTKCITDLVETLVFDP
ncbi:peritrophin-44-like [Wyeomyia smithii]|uniref:peritrophin-44-like n=1 Tax=Wyeomyia smithii TaxID=174621 RepID=UPI002467F1B5|nr:peritrophin-44-like [Wyeomyia smithii]